MDRIIDLYFLKGVILVAFKPVSKCYYLEKRLFYIAY